MHRESPHLVLSNFQLTVICQSFICRSLSQMSFVHCYFWLKKNASHTSASYTVVELLCWRLLRVDPRDAALRRAAAISYSGRANSTSPVHGEHLVVEATHRSGGQNRKFAESLSKQTEVFKNTGFEGWQFKMLTAAGTISQKDSRCDGASHEQPRQGGPRKRVHI